MDKPTPTKRRKSPPITGKVGENSDAQNCDIQDLSSQLDATKCYKVSVSSGIPKASANLKVQWKANGVEGAAGLKVGDETECLKKPVTKLVVHCTEGRSVTYSLVECKCSRD